MYEVFALGMRDLVFDVYALLGHLTLRFFRNLIYTIEWFKKLNILKSILIGNIPSIGEV